MSNIRNSRLGRRAAEQVLDGVPGDQHADRTPLASVLAAAAAPSRPAEQAGEDAAVTAFRAEHLVPVDQSRRGQMIKSPLAKLLTIKVAAAALAVSAGGVALAAGTGAFTPATHVTSHVASAGAAVGQTNTSTHAAAGAGASAARVHAHAAIKSAPVLKAPLSPVVAVNVCRSVAGLAYATVLNADNTTAQILSETGLQKALESTALAKVLNNPQFDALVTTAMGKTNVADYCGLLLHLAKLPVPGQLVKLNAALLSGLPAVIVSEIPGSALSGLPVADLSRLPVGFLSRLSVPALAGVAPKLSAGTLTGLLAKLPTGSLATVLPKLPTGSLTQLLPKLPAGSLTSLLPKLPASTLTRLPAGSLTSLLTRLPAGSVTGILTKLPAGSLTRILPKLPASLLSGLPHSLLAGLPSSLLSQLPLG
jgi:hypothetical protein